MIDISRIKKAKKLSISFSLDSELNEFLREHAKKLGVNKSQLIQALVRDFYESITEDSNHE